MEHSRSGKKMGLLDIGGLLLAFLLLFGLFSCSFTQVKKNEEQKPFRDTLSLVKEVKEFGRTLGIEPTAALGESKRGSPVHSMLWLWLQRLGTIALRAPIDIRLGMSFSAAKEELPLERLYNVSGYSVYFRQGNQFADARSVTTTDFARESVLTRVTTVLHEDLHDDRNFKLPWESEESIITPVGELAALEFFKSRDDQANADGARAQIEEERTLSRELTSLAQEAQKVFAMEPLAEARKTIIARVRSYPTYGRWFKFQIGEQDPDVALEAKMSHDLAYYRYYDRIVSLYEKKGDLKQLIQELKEIPRDASVATVERYLEALEQRYGVRAA
jgi:hypothetical protein